MTGNGFTVFLNNLKTEVAIESSEIYEINSIVA